MLKISYMSKNIEIDSGYLEVLLRISALHIKDPVEGIAQVIRDDWLYISSGGHCEIIGPDFESYIADQRGREVASNALCSAIHALRHASMNISDETLNLLWPEKRFSCDIPAAKLVALGNELLVLIGMND